MLRIVDQCVDLAEGLQGAVDQRLAILFVSNVCSNHYGGSAGSLDLFSAAIFGRLIEVRNHDSGAFASEVAADASSHPAAG